MKLALVLILPVFGFAQQTNFAPATSGPATTLSPITPGQRAQWVIESTILPTNVLGNALGAGIETGLNSPKELGTHWTGFQKRYVNSMATGALSNGIEAGVGALWGEDPRYLPAAAGTSLKGRVMRTAKWTFMAANSDGTMHPAYARFIAIPAANGLSNIWRPDSETDFDHFAERTALGFAGHLGGNAWNEFWPDVKKKVLHKGSGSGPFAGL